MRGLNKKAIGMTALVVLLLLLTGTMRLVESEKEFINVICFLLIYTIYIGMLAYWSLSIRRRMMHSPIRNYLLGTASLMLFWIFLRTLKHRSFAYIEPVARWLWYCFYIPMILIPLLTFFAALCLDKHEGWRPELRYNLLFIPAVALILGILTNDLHGLAFDFPLGIENWASNYTYQILYFIVVLWMVGLFLVAIWLFFKKSYIPHTKKRLWMPLAVIGIAIVYTVLYAIDNSKTSFGFIEMTAMLCVLTAGIWESFFHSGMLPSNTKYSEFFDVSPLGAQIVDKKGLVHYRSMQAEPVATSEHYAAPIKGGYVIWKEDVSQISLFIKELHNTKTELMDSVELLKDELRSKSRRLHVDEQNRLHNLTVHLVMPQIEKMKEILAAATQASATEKPRLLWNLNVLGAYIKRRANLVLMAEGQETVTAYDLARCFEESFENLEAGGIHCVLLLQTSCEIPPDQAMLFYDFFEVAIEAALPSLNSISVTLSDKEKEIILSIKMKSDTGEISFSNGLWQKGKFAAFGGRIVYAEGSTGVFNIRLYLLKGGGMQ